LLFLHRTALHFYPDPHLTEHEHSSKSIYVTFAGVTDH